MKKTIRKVVQIPFQLLWYAIIYTFHFPALLYLTKMKGFTIVGDLPRETSFITFYVPHRKGFGDIILGLSICCAKLIPPLKFLVKREALMLFIKPFENIPLWLPNPGVLLYLIGAISTDRRSNKPQGQKQMFIQKLIDLFQEKRMILVIVPEGTRKVGASWQTGFYRIALAAKKPIEIVGVEFNKKIITAMDKPYYLTGNVKQDLDYLSDWMRQHTSDYNPVIDYTKFEEVVK